MTTIKPLSATFLVSVGLFTITSYLPEIRPFKAPPHSSANVLPTPVDLHNIYEPVFHKPTTNNEMAVVYTQPTETPYPTPETAEVAVLPAQTGIVEELFQDTETEQGAVLSEQTDSAPPTESTITVEPNYLGTISIVGPELGVEPIDRNASIVIPKINVNSPIALETPVNDRNAYMKALEIGVAHAKGTSLPTDQPDTNTYLFAHSTANEANIARYAAVFTKTKQLTTGDRITVFHQGKRFDYEITQQEVVPSFDTTVLTRTHDYPALTLQTCDPPGQAINRFLTTAKLVGVYDK